MESNEAKFLEALKREASEKALRESSTIAPSDLLAIVVWVGGLQFAVYVVSGEVELLDEPAF